MNIPGENLMTLIPNIIRKESQELIAQDSIASDILKKLNISLDALPQKHQVSLQNVSSRQIQLKINPNDSVALNLLHSRNITEILDQDYEILILKQKNKELQTKIDNNNKLLKHIRDELASSRDLLLQQSPNAENINDHIRKLKQKVASYEESCEKATRKFSKLNLPEELLPGALKSLVSTLSELSMEEKMLQQRAEDVSLAREARKTLVKLARG